MTPAAFESFDWRSFDENTTELIAESWMLITPGVSGTSGEERRWNTMTASWGGFGHQWNMDVAFVFVRPSRHTFGFMEREEGFTLSFFDGKWKKALELCGSKSGRDVDKAAEAGITPRAFPSANSARRVGFEEARIVLSCRKVYSQDLDPGNFIDSSISKCYPEGDLHRLYVGAIEGAWANPGRRRIEAE
jgi:flavin reductase (DIM6/NTAB) family NADH-FMN oxidoreductase RutF